MWTEGPAEYGQLKGQTVERIRARPSIIWGIDFSNFSLSSAFCTRLPSQQYNSATRQDGGVTIIHSLDSTILTWPLMWRASTLPFQLWRSYAEGQTLE